MTDKKLVSLLFKKGVNSEIADRIRKAKGITNNHDNVVVHQEKKSICDTAKKLSKLIKAVDPDATITIKNKEGKWED